MRRIVIAVTVGGLLLLSGVAASAKPAAEQGQHGQQQTDKRPAGAPAAAPAAKATTAPTPGLTPIPANKPATAASPTTCSAPAAQTGEFEGEHQDADCNDKQDESRANESKTEANDKTAETGNQED